MKFGSHTHIRARHNIIDVFSGETTPYYAGEGEKKRVSINAAERASRAMPAGSVRTAESLERAA